MTDSVNLLRLFGSAPKDENNRFVQDPRTDAFFEGLAKSTPLNPPQLLEFAGRFSKDPAMAPMAGRLVLQAIGDIGHDRRALEILSKVADEQIAWGLSVRDLLAKITKAYQGLSPRSIGTGPGSSGSSNTSTSYAFTAPGSGCTYQPPTGPAVTLAPKQTLVFAGPIRSGGFNEGSYVITVTCLDILGLPCLEIETVTHRFTS
jgi:hypothetical protein